MIFLFIFCCCIFDSTVTQKETEYYLNYADSSGTNKGKNNFLSRTPRDISNESTNCSLPSSEAIFSYTKVDCDYNCVILPGVSIQSTEVVKINCALGYGPASNTQYDVNYVCNKGKWFNREPECVKLCPALKKEHLIFECFHGVEQVNCDSFMRPGTVAKFRCDEFYRASYDPMSYSDRITCLTGGSWSERLPTCSLVCGLVNQVNKVDATLVRANKTRYGEYPWHVAIYINVTNRYEYICGGSLIAENFVLTAAHCMFDPNENYVKFKETDLKVAVGKGKRDYYIQERYQVNSDVINIIVPETYVGDGTRYTEDIALLQTYVSFEFNHFVLPVCLDRFGVVTFDKNTKGTITGWGLTEGGKLSDELREVHLPIMPIVQCRIFFPEFLQFLTTDKYCVIHQNGSGTGMGDSGGGMTFDALGQHYIRGIVSIKKTDSTLFSAFTNVSIYMQWIYDSMRNRHGPTIVHKICENWKKYKTCKNEETALISSANEGVAKAQPRTYTYMATLGTGEAEDSIKWLCGGALISERWVLTQADCVQPSSNAINTIPKWVKLGDLDINSSSDDARPELKRIIETVIHPEYKPAKYYPPNYYSSRQAYNDLALVKLDSPVHIDEYIAPACLHTSKEIPSANTPVITAWGSGEGYDGPVSSHLLVADSPLVNDSACSRYYARTYALAGGIIDDLLICAKEKICRGTSGAPLTFTLDGGCTWTVIGIAAYGLRCGPDVYPGVYSRVSASLPWIQSVVWPNA